MSETLDYGSTRSKASDRLNSSVNDENRGDTVSEMLYDIEELLPLIRQDARRFYSGGNMQASTRVRKALMCVQNVSQALRAEILANRDWVPAEVKAQKAAQEKILRGEE